MTAEQPPYQTPEWLQARISILGELGFSTDDYDEFGAHYAKHTDVVAAECFELTLSNHDEAIEEIPHYLERFEAINKDPRFNIGLLTPVTPEQFGLIINIVSLQYECFDEDRREQVLVKICNFLGKKNCLSVPGYTAQIRNPELVRDLVGHWNIYWPLLSEYIRYASKEDPEQVMQSLDDHRNNPTMFALAIPSASTPASTRDRFRRDYPSLSRQGIDIIAAGLLYEGAHSEILREKGLEFYRDYSWEETIYRMLKEYGEEYHNQILEAIVNRAPHIFDNNELTFIELAKKLRNSSFLLSEEGELVRFSTG